MGRPRAALCAALCAASVAATQGNEGTSFSKAVEPVFNRPASDDRCPCQDPMSNGTCYEPACPPGYFRCCVNCTQSTCFGTVRMELSYRGVPECIQCAPGDYCDGCDNFQKCPDNDTPERKGEKISPPGSTRFNDCESCPPDKEAGFDRSVCMFKYSDVCSKDYVRRCMNNCWAVDPMMGKNMTPCEEMKCMMYCSRQWSTDCGAAVALHCRYMVSGQDGVVSLLPNAPPPQAALLGCDVDCNDAPRATLPVLAALTLLVTWPWA
uniref:TNFR-Cys domain-containing protein n=1 Tax=Alexandrium monilatum TaxID=311494 RepID=A0A7S4Q445_9DINO